MWLSLLLSLWLLVFGVVVIVVVGVVLFGVVAGVSCLCLQGMMQLRIVGARAVSVLNAFDLGHGRQSAPSICIDTGLG